MYRAHLTIMEPYTKDYADTSTEAFRVLAGNVTLSLNEALKQYRGIYTPKVVAIMWVDICAGRRFDRIRCQHRFCIFIRRPSNDKFFVRAVVDIESVGDQPKETLENQLRYFISNSRSYNPSSSLTVIDRGFDIKQGKRFTLDGRRYVRIGRLFTGDGGT